MRGNVRTFPLRGIPNFNPEGLLTRSASAYSEGGNLVGMIRESYIAKRIAIDHFGVYAGGSKPIAGPLSPRSQSSRTN